MDYLQNAQPGDRFAVTYYGFIEDFLTVDWVSQDSILASDGVKYSKKTGLEIPLVEAKPDEDSDKNFRLASKRLIQLTPEVENEINVKKETETLTEYILTVVKTAPIRGSKVSISQLRQIKSILEN